MSLPTPNTRKEQYLNAIATENASGLPTPITREEEYLDAIAKGGGSGDGDMKKSVYDSDLDVAGAGGIKAFVSNAVSGKVDKVEGKGLSSNDYTDEDKAIVDGVTDALATKQDVLTFDDEPTANSNNPVKSSGIYSAIKTVSDKVDNLEKAIIYGFHIDGNESDSDAKVTYLAGAIGLTPAHMDYTTGKFDYGSWENAFFMPKLVMLKQDGTVDCYLDPNDDSKKLDGTDSHAWHLGIVETSTTAVIAHAVDDYFVLGDKLYQATSAIAIGDTIESGTNCTEIAGVDVHANVMVEWGQNGKKIWSKIVPTDNHEGCDVYIANAQIDSEYNDFAFHNKNGVSMDHFYTPAYNGSLVNNVLRSLPSMQVMSSKTATQQRTYAQANGSDMWDIEKKVDIDLINNLLILIGKSTNTQAVFGQGLHTGGNAEVINNNFRTGVHSIKGMFYGTNNGIIADGSYTNAVKVFFMENWWGFQFRRYLGHILVNGVQKLKLTYGKEDGTGCTGFNLTGADYLTEGVTLTGSSGGYIDKMYYSENGVFPKNAGGDSTHHYCDGLYFDNTLTSVALRGGSPSLGAKDGAFCVSLNNTELSADWRMGAALSCKPLA